jgi:hypothetical protein
MGSQTRVLPVELALGTQNSTEQRGDDQPHNYVGRVRHRVDELWVHQSLPP